MDIVVMGVDEIRPYEKNARKHADEDVSVIMRSIEEFGFNDPIGIWGPQNIIVEGHGRLMAAKKLGMKEVPCIRLDDLSDEQRRAYALAHNRTAELSVWDPDLLPLELEDLPNYDMTEFGFTSPAEEDPEEAREDEYDGSVPEQPRSKLGDLYQLGRHRLLCGDATMIDQVMRLMDGQLADLLITDPPYNVDYVGKTKDSLKIQNDNMEDEKFRGFLRDSFLSADMVMKPGAVFYIWHADSEGYNFRGACTDIGWKVRQCLIWNKNSMVMGRQDYQWKHEPCLYGWKDGAGHLWASDRR